MVENLLRIQSLVASLTAAATSREFLLHLKYANNKECLNRVFFLFLNLKINFEKVLDYLKSASMVFNADKIK